MKTKYNFDIEPEIIEKNLKRITNQIYKLLPEREEHLDWENHLRTIIIELAGMAEILIEYRDSLFCLLCKLEGAAALNKKEDFILFRKTIFECLIICNKIEVK